MRLGLPSLRLNRISSAREVVSPADALIALGITPLAQFSPFLTRSGWAGSPVERGRRSTDQAERDFYATVMVNGYPCVDAAELADFSQGGHVQITTMYEQMGSGLHAIQETPTLQPYAVTSGVPEIMAGAPSIRFVSSAGHRLIAPITVPAGACTIAATAQVTTSNAAQGIMAGDIGTNGRTYLRASYSVSMGNSAELQTAFSNDPQILLASVAGNGNTTMQARTQGADYGPMATVRGTPGGIVSLGRFGEASGTTFEGKGGDWTLISGAPELALVGPFLAAMRRLVG